MATIQTETFRSKWNLRLAILSELARPLLKLYARSFSPDSRLQTSPQGWKLGLLLGGSHIGDILYRTASLPGLQESLPSCSWICMTTPPAEQVVQNNPHLIGQITASAFNSPAAELRERLISQFGRLPDVAICYDSGTYWKPLLLATRLGIPNRVAYVHKGFSGLVTHPVTYPGCQPYPKYFQDLVTQLRGLPATGSLRPRVYPDPADEAAAFSWRHQHGLTADEPVIACFCTSRQPTGVWPVNSFVEALKHIRSQSSVKVVLCGAAQDRALLEDVNRQAGLRSPILAGDLGLRALVSFLQGCSVVLSTDSGPRHLANAANTPVVFIRNLSFSQVEAGAYCETDHDMAPNVEWVPPDQQAAIMARISPATVAEKVLSLLCGKSKTL